MAGKEKPMIVIKKIQGGGAGHHGGAWKVAFADFMTAMMAFFLVMWLLQSSEETKKAISDYFSTPSVIEYNFANYGVEVTLEKLFLDLMNEPLKTLQTMFEPMDSTPNMFDMGSPRVVLAYITDQLGDYAKNLTVNKDGSIEFDIREDMLFKTGSAEPAAKFVEIMDKVAKITTGLQDSQVDVGSFLMTSGVEDGTVETAEKVAAHRLDMIKLKVASGFEGKGSEDGNNLVTGKTFVREKQEGVPADLNGFMRFKIKQREDGAAELRPKLLDDAMNSHDNDMQVYDKYVDKLSGSDDSKKEHDKK
ncbi:MAG: flagellar motor protein MotB [Pseudobdellovibrionaceae bacterium]